MEGRANFGSPSACHIDEPVVECGICGFTGVESVSMAHADAEHAMRPVYECGHCGFVFWKEFDLTLHVRNVHNTVHRKPSRECVFCASVFRTSSALNCHLRENHVASQPIMCRFCGLFCHGGDMVARHIRENHARTQFLYCKEKNVAGSDVECRVSGSCGAFFMSPAALDEHMKQSHEDHPVKSGEALKKDDCDRKCDVLFMVDCEQALQLDGENSIAPQWRHSVGDMLAEVAGKASPCSTQEHLCQCIAPAPSLSLACVVCGLKHSRVEELSKHMSLLHRSSEALPVAVTEFSLRMVSAESTLSPDGTKKDPGAAASKNGPGVPKLAHKAKPSRWTRELDDMFIRAIRTKGFSNDTLAAFQSLHSADRSMASLRSRGYQRGFKMVPSASRAKRMKLV